MDANIPRLAHLVVSTEAFYDPVKNFFLGESKKGADYKPVEQKHTYNNKALITAISRTYGDPAWLKQQRWLSGNIPAGDILPYMVLGHAQAHPESALATASLFYLNVYRQWQASCKAYFQALQPVVGVMKGELTDVALEAALALLKQIGPPDGFYTKPPRVFPIMSRPLPKRHEKLRAVLRLNPQTKTRTLRKEEVPHLIKQILETLAHAEKIREAIIQDAEFAVASGYPPKLFRLAHNKGEPPPKGSERPKEEWVQVAKALDPSATYWSSGPFTATRTCYSELVLAVCTWIDRSIK